jgi:hypothetical protein
MPTQPTIAIAGRDDNGQTLLAGIDAGGTEVRTLELSAGSGPGRGVLTVAVNSGLGPSGLGALGSGSFTVTTSAVQIGFPAGTRSVLIQNDDGVEPANTSTGAVFFGNSGVTTANGAVLRQSQQLALDLSDGATEPYFIAAGAGRVLRWFAMGA